MGIHQGLNVNEHLFGEVPGKLERLINERNYRGNGLAFLCNAMKMVWISIRSPRLMVTLSKFIQVKQSKPK